jgi:hypothetical protein
MLLALVRTSSLNGQPTGDSLVDAAHCLRLRLIAFLIAWLTPFGAELCELVAFADGVAVIAGSVAVAVPDALGEGAADGVSTVAVAVGRGVGTTFSEKNLS